MYSYKDVFGLNSINESLFQANVIQLKEKFETFLTYCCSYSVGIMNHNRKDVKIPILPRYPRDQDIIFESLPESYQDYNGAVHYW